VSVRDFSQTVVDGALQRLNSSLQREVKKGRSSQGQMDTVLKNLQGSDSAEAFQDADFVIEAVAERMDLKKKCFAELDKTCKPGAILATNTSTLSISQIATATGRPDKVIGMHFMNPVPIMKLVEVIVGDKTSKETTEATLALATRMDKTAAQAKDTPGFISNRILCPMINEAILCLEAGTGTRESIDTVMKLGMNHPMGPLQLADLVGLDTLLSVMEILEDGFKDKKYRPAPLLRDMVKAGHLGKKSGKGFYDYSQGDNK
jgi:3-hydroxybutyryl-CoA dehydrogenase